MPTTQSRQDGACTTNALAQPSPTRVVRACGAVATAWLFVHSAEKVLTQHDPRTQCRSMDSAQNTSVSRRALTPSYCMVCARVSVMGLCPHHHCRGASTARAVSTVSPLPAHRQRRVPREPAFVHCAGTVCLAVCCACVRHGDNHQWAGIPWVRRVVHHPLCVVWAMCLACHHTLMHLRPASACVCHTVTPTTFHSGRV